MSQLFFKRFDSVNPQLKFESDYNELTDVGTTYLGKNGTDHSSPFILGESFPCDPYAWTTGILPDGSQVTVQIDMGATKCNMSKGFYDAYPILHSLPKYKPYMTTLEIGDGSHVPVNFIIPLIISFKDHTFEIYTLVNGSTNNKLLLLGMKNAIETEGVICARTFQLEFLNRSAPLFPTQSYIVPTRQKCSVKLDVAFPVELSSMAIIKLIRHLQFPVAMKVQIICNQVVLELENNCTCALYFPTHLQIGIVDMRSLGYFHIPHETIAKSLSPKYKMVTANHMQALMNKVSTSVQEVYMPKASNTDIDQYPWLDPEDPQRHMTDEEILYKTIDLSKSALDAKGKQRLMDMIGKHKGAFSLRDKIGECPNLEFNIDMIDDSPFFVRPFNISEEDKPIMDRQMNRLVSLGILSKNNTSHTSPVMLLTHKLTKDKCPIVDF